MTRKTISVRNILKGLCLICLLQTIVTLYFILKIYISNVMRPDLVSENLMNDYDSLPIYDQSQSFVLPEGEINIEEIFKGERKLFKNEIKYVSPELKLTEPSRLPTVEILGKAAIASYLWEHILQSTKAVDPQDNTIYSARLTMANCILNYKEGPGLQLNKVDFSADSFVLVLNGRTPEKVQESKEWLTHFKNATPSPKVVLMMLGNELCDNDWVREFLHPKGPVRGSFVTYDDPAFDEETAFQWPLGVATYRHFPPLTHADTNPSHPRPFLCNLQATAHPNSSRAPLFSFLASSRLAARRCIVRERKEWAPSESPESSTQYLRALLTSDVTLCPAGLNTETYRVYEAMAAGSVPVVEDVPSKGSCDKASGWRLLKRFNAPVIWVKDWRGVKGVLVREAKLSPGEKIVRRRKLLSWYEWFKLKNSDRFLTFLGGVV